MQVRKGHNGQWPYKQSLQELLVGVYYHKKKPIPMEDRPTNYISPGLACIEIPFAYGLVT